MKSSFECSTRPLMHSSKCFKISQKHSDVYIQKKGESKSANILKNCFCCEHYDPLYILFQPVPVNTCWGFTSKLECKPWVLKCTSQIMLGGINHGSYHSCLITYILFIIVKRKTKNNVIIRKER